MRVLWGRRTSINVQKVAWVLEETNLPFDQIEVGGAHKGNDTPEYLAMNPTGRVPTLVDGAITLWESNAVCRYIVAVYGGPLAGPAAAERAHADMWMEWYQNGLYAPFISVFYQTVRLPEAKRSAEKLEHALGQVNGHLAVAEEALAAQPYLSGAQLGLGDIPFGACLYRYFTMPIPRPDFPAIERYYAGLCERPAYQNGVMVSYESLRSN